MRPYLMCPLALAMFVSPLQAQSVFRSGVDLVHLGVTVVGKDGQVKVGLRSQRGYDCSPLAVSMGGGGHAQACGFRLPGGRLAQLLSGVFQADETGASS